MNGWIVLDKPEGISSAGALNQIKRLLPRKIKIGHAGTLDPFATGMLLVAIGEATKLTDYVMAHSKKYEFTIEFGRSTDTLDRDGAVIMESDARALREELSAAALTFVGEYNQMPPAFSALKINGERAYKLARQGLEVELQPRAVMLNAIELLDYSSEQAKFKISCGKGFYVRSLARDICHKLGIEGHLVALRRTATGKFNENAMISLETLLEMLHNADHSMLHKPHSVLDDILVRSCSDEVAEALRHGKQVSNSSGWHGTKFLMNNGNLVAIVECTEFLKPRRILNL